MLLLEDVTYASNVFRTYVIVFISKLCCFPQIRFELSIILFICELNCNIISAANSVYVMCICLIYYNLGCDVELPRSFVTLGGLSGLYK